MNLKEFLNINKIDVETYFNDKMEECENLDGLPREIASCVCCVRHKRDFPVLGEPLTTVRKPKNSTYKHECDCPCRHIARHLCREYIRVHEIEDISQTDDESEYDSDSVGSLEDFIVEDYGFNKKERKTLDKALNKFRGKKTLRR